MNCLTPISLFSISLSEIKQIPSTSWDINLKWLRPLGTGWNNRLNVICVCKVDRTCQSLGKLWCVCVYILLCLRWLYCESPYFKWQHIWIINLVPYSYSVYQISGQLGEHVPFGNSWSTLNNLIANTLCRNCFHKEVLLLCLHALKSACPILHFGSHLFGLIWLHWCR